MQSLSINAAAGSRVCLETVVLRSAGILAYCSCDFDKSLECLLKVLESDSWDWEALTYIGLVYKKLGLAEKARQSLELVEKHCPDQRWQELARLAL